MSNLIACLLVGLAACCVLPPLANSLFAQTTKNGTATKTLTPAAPALKKSPVQQTQGTSTGRGNTEGRATVRDADDAGGGRAPSGQRPSRPEPQPLHVPNPSPELWQVLQDWEVESSKVKRLTGSFKRFVYDDTFQTDKRAIGSFAYEAPDKGNYVLTGAEPKKDEVSRQTNKDKQPYKIVVDAPERWVCTGTEVIKIDEKQRTYEKVTIPEEERGQNIIDGPLPFLFGMKANQAVRRYQITLYKQTETEVWLDVEPRLSKDAVNWKKSRVIIDATTFLPKAVQMIDPTGNRTTVHTFSNLEVNKRNSLFGGDPFQPNLKNYKLILNEKPAPVSSNPGPGGAPKNRTSANERNDRELPRTAAVPSSAPAGSKKSAGGTINR